MHSTHTHISHTNATRILDGRGSFSESDRAHKYVRLQSCSVKEAGSTAKPLPSSSLRHVCSQLPALPTIGLPWAWQFRSRGYPMCKLTALSRGIDLNRSERLPTCPRTDRWCSRQHSTRCTSRPCLPHTDQSVRTCRRHWSVWPKARACAAAECLHRLQTKSA